MAREFIDLSLFQDHIAAWVAERRPALIICELLQQNGVAVHRTKLQRTLRECGLSYGRNNVIQDMEGELQVKPEFFFHECHGAAALGAHPPRQRARRGRVDHARCAAPDVRAQGGLLDGAVGGGGGAAGAKVEVPVAGEEGACRRTKSEWE